ncbi:MAG: glycoside hydrolase family 43 protein [Bacteroides cellulosilyticus]|nr:glycoside hydrolase family 43 protein [Bacteroides cellulosilyticus]
MKKQIILFILLLSILPIIGLGQNNKGKKEKSAPVFTQVVYQGDDRIYRENPLKSDEFYNPILQGCYPDPSITRKGEDYFLVCSSFAMFPGVPIFHSKDLVNWRQIGHVLDRPSQLIVYNAGTSDGVYAPTIRYNPHNDTFYMITTQMTGGFGNMMVKTQDPFKGWSDPIKLNFGGIDPSIFFDDDGKAYIVHNDGPVKSLYSGHRTIKIREYDVEKDCLIPDTDKIIVDGGTKFDKKPFWIEAPHIYKKNGRYYLICAEGGTGDGHSEVIFVSNHVKGPYIEAPGNPILTQRHLPLNRENKVDWAGHADIVKGSDGKYYGVFLAIRPNENNRINIGRETFILPVDWTGTFPIFENGLIPMEPKLKLPKGIENKTGKNGFLPNGNFAFKDSFHTARLDYRWVGMRCPAEQFATVTKEGLKITPFTTNIKEKKPLSALWCRQQHTDFSFTAVLKYKPEAETDLAGIACLQSKGFNYVFGVTKHGKEYYLVLQRTQKGISEIIASTPVEVKAPLHLQVKATEDKYQFSFSTDGIRFTNVGIPVSGDILSTNVAGGFVGCMLGMYTTLANDAHPQE